MFISFTAPLRSALLKTGSYGALAVALLSLYLGDHISPSNVPICGPTTACKRQENPHSKITLRAAMERGLQGIAKLKQNGRASNLFSIRGKKMLTQHFFPQALTTLTSVQCI